MDEPSLRKIQEISLNANLNEISSGQPDLREFIPPLEQQLKQNFSFVSHSGCSPNVVSSHSMSDNCLVNANSSCENHATTFFTDGINHDARTSVTQSKIIPPNCQTTMETLPNTLLFGCQEKKINESTASPLVAENPFKIRIPIRTLLSHYVALTKDKSSQKKNFSEPLISLAPCPKNHAKTPNEHANAQHTQSLEQNSVNTAPWSSSKDTFSVNSTINRRSSTGTYEKEQQQQQQSSVQDSEGLSRRQKRTSCTETVTRGRGRGTALDNSTSSAARGSNLPLRVRSSRTHQSSIPNDTHQQDVWNRSSEGGDNNLKAVAQPGSDLQPPVWRRKDTKHGGASKTEVSTSTSEQQLQNFRKTSQTPLQEISSTGRRSSPETNKPFVDSLLGLSYSEGNVALFNTFSKLERVPDRRRCLQTVSHNQQRLNGTACISMDETPVFSKEPYEIQMDDNDAKTLKSSLVQTNIVNPGSDAHFERIQEGSKTESLGAVSVFQSPSEFPGDPVGGGFEPESDAWIPANVIPEPLSLEPQRPLYSLFTDQSSSYNVSPNDIPAVKDCHSSFLLGSVRNKQKINDANNVTCVKPNCDSTTSLFSSTFKDQLYQDKLQAQPQPVMNKMYTIEDFGNSLHPHQRHNSKSTDFLSNCVVNANSENERHLSTHQVSRSVRRKDQDDLNKLLRQIRQFTHKEVLQRMTADELLDRLQSACSNDNTFGKGYNNETSFDPSFELPETVEALSDCLVSQVLASREISKQKQQQKVASNNFHPLQSWKDSIKTLDASLEDPQPKNTELRYICDGTQAQSMPPPPPTIFDEKSSQLPPAHFDPTTAGGLASTQLLIRDNEEKLHVDDKCHSCQKQKPSMIISPFSALHECEKHFRQNESHSPEMSSAFHLNTDQSAVTFPFGNESVKKLSQNSSSNNKSNNNILIPISPNVNNGGGSSEHSKYVHPRTNDILLQMQQESHDNRCIDEHSSLYSNNFGIGEKDNVLESVAPGRNELLGQNPFLWRTTDIQKDVDHKVIVHDVASASEGFMRNNEGPSHSINNIMGDVVASSQPERPPFPLDRAIWEYKDLTGQIQGLFTSLQMKAWFDGNFFSPDLLMRYSPNMSFVPFCFLYSPKLYDTYPPFLDYPCLTTRQEFDVPHGLNQETVSNSSARTLSASSEPQPRIMLSHKQSTSVNTQASASNVNPEKQPLQQPLQQPQSQSQSQRQQQQMSRAAMMTHGLRAMLRIGQHDNDLNNETLKTYNPSLNSNSFFEKSMQNSIQGKKQDLVSLDVDPVQSITDIGGINSSNSSSVSRNVSNAEKCSGFTYTSEKVAPENNKEEYRNPSPPSKLETMSAFHESDFPSSFGGSANQSVVTAKPRTQLVTMSDVTVTSKSGELLPPVKNTIGLKGSREKNPHSLQGGQKLGGFSDKPGLQNSAKQQQQHRVSGGQSMFSNGSKVANTTTKPSAATSSNTQTTTESTYLLKNQNIHPSQSSTLGNSQEGLRVDDTSTAEGAANFSWGEKERSKKPKTWKVPTVTNIINDIEFLEPLPEHSLSQNHKTPKMTKFSAVTKTGHEVKKTTRTLQDFMKSEVKQKPVKSAWNKATSVVIPTYDFSEDPKVVRTENYTQQETEVAKQIPEVKKQGHGPRLKEQQQQHASVETVDCVLNNNKNNKSSSKINTSSNNNKNNKTSNSTNKNSNNDNNDSKSKNKSNNIYNNYYNNGNSITTNNNSSNSNNGNFSQDTEFLEDKGDPAHAWITVAKKKSASTEKQNVKQNQSSATASVAAAKNSSPANNKLQQHQIENQPVSASRSLITSVQKALATFQIDLPEQSILELCEDYKTPDRLLEFLTPFIVNDSKLSAVANTLSKLTQANSGSVVIETDLSSRGPKLASKKQPTAYNHSWNNIVVGMKDNNLNTKTDDPSSLSQEAVANKNGTMNVIAKQTGTSGGHRGRRVVKGKFGDPSLLV